MVPVTRPSLLARAGVAGDDDAWAELVGLYSPVVYRYCRRRGLQDQDAQDVTSVVFIKLQEKLPGFSYDPKLGRFRSFLYKIVRGKISDFLKGTKRHGDRIAQAGENLLARGAERLEEVKEHLAGRPGWDAAVTEPEAPEADHEDPDWVEVFYCHLFEAAVGMLTESGELSANQAGVVRLWWTMRAETVESALDALIADRLGLSPASVPALKSRAFAKIREKLLELAEECPRFLLD